MTAEVDTASEKSCISRAMDGQLTVCLLILFVYFYRSFNDVVQQPVPNVEW